MSTIHVDKIYFRFLTQLIGNEIVVPQTDRVSRSSVSIYGCHLTNLDNNCFILLLLID